MDLQAKKKPVGAKTPESPKNLPIFSFTTIFRILHFIAFLDYCIYRFNFQKPVGTQGTHAYAVPVLKYVSSW